MTHNPRLGRYVTCHVTEESFQAFVPPSLPPVPPIDLQPLQNVLVRASQSLGRLNSVAEALPNRQLLLYYYVRKEAVLSSQIEGTQSSLSDLLLYESEEMPSTPLDDVAEVSSYVAALEHDLQRVEGGFPLSLRLIREMHGILLAKGRGSHQQPGEFRTTQNWIGGSRPGNARFVPPPPQNLMECLDSLEKYLHIAPRPYTALIEAGLIHVQFETIHPFLDGNGRVGRLLITFFLMMMEELTEPVLYLSLFFKNNRNEYYERLSAVRSEGDWEGWLQFFLTGVADTADQVVTTTQSIQALLKKHAEQIQGLGRAGISAGKVHELLSRKAIVSVKQVASDLEMTAPTARSSLKHLSQRGIIQDIRGKGKERLYLYGDLLAILEQGAEPIRY